MDVEYGCVGYVGYIASVWYGCALDVANYASKQEGDKKGVVNDCNTSRDAIDARVERFMNESCVSIVSWTGNEPNHSSHSLGGPYSYQRRRPKTVAIDWEERPKKKNDNTSQSLISLK